MSSAAASASASSALPELDSAQAVDEFLQKHANAVMVFSAHWCGPCQRSKPELQALASKLLADVTLDVHSAIAYESDLGESIHKYNVRAFPTYALYQAGKEVDRVEGANLPAVEEMVRKHGCMALTGGETLGGGGVPLTAEERRAARLAKLGGGEGAPVANGGDGPATAAPMETDDDDAKKTASEAPPEDAKDVEMKDASEGKTGDKADDNTDPLSKLDSEAIRTLTENMGFPLIRAQKGLLKGGNNVEGAVEWLMEHQDDDDIDDPITADIAHSFKCIECPADDAPGTGGAVAQSYKCNECGKVLSNMANLELHANKTGHSDFEESTQSVKPLTAEEKAAKIAEIKELLKAKRAEREAAEKVDDIEREKQRRSMGKEMHKTREQLEMEQRKREAQQRKREKDAFKKERARLRAELAKDKAERQSNKGKLGSKLGVEGYSPDGIQYDVPADDGAASAGPSPNKKAKADAAKIDDYIGKVSSYKAGGDGGKCLKVLKAYVGNVVDHPDETKFRTINMDNKAFKTKVKPFVGAKHLLIAVGFAVSEEEPNHLVLKQDADRQLLADTKQKICDALQAYG